MQPTPTTRGHHALRWAMGVGLVFVVVAGMGLLEARRRAAEQWLSVLSHCEENELRVSPVRWIHVPGLHESFSETRGGNIFREWRQGQWKKSTIVLRQERCFFGSSLEVRVSGYEPFAVGRVLRTFAGVDVEVVVEPPGPLSMRRAVKSMRRAIKQE